MGIALTICAVFARMGSASLCEAADQGDAPRAGSPAPGRATETFGAWSIGLVREPILLLIGSVRTPGRLLLVDADPALGADFRR